MNAYYHFAEPFIKKVLQDDKTYEELKNEKFSKAAYYRLFDSEFVNKEVIEYVIKYARNFYDRADYEGN